MFQECFVDVLSGARLKVAGCQRVWVQMAIEEIW